MHGMTATPLNTANSTASCASPAVRYKDSSPLAANDDTLFQQLEARYGDVVAEHIMRQLPAR